MMLQPLHGTFLMQSSLKKVKNYSFLYLQSSWVGSGAVPGCTIIDSACRILPGRSEGSLAPGPPSSQPPGASVLHKVQKNLTKA
jgi:hypothetical protein